MHLMWSHLSYISYFVVSILKELCVQGKVFFNNNSLYSNIVSFIFIH